MPRQGYHEKFSFPADTGLTSLFASQATLDCNLKEFAYITVDFHGVVFFPSQSIFFISLVHYLTSVSSFSS